MFISLGELYKKANSDGVAVGAFNTNNLEVTQAIVEAAEKTGFPLIIATTPAAIKYAGLKEIFDIVKDLIDESKIPMLIHLDHGKDIELIKECLDAGYRSVMFDGSDLLYENNVSETKKVVELAHKYSAVVEAEVGVVGRGEEGREKILAKYSDPDIAADFVKLTGVDSLAVSIGNIHGAPENEKLNVDLLKEIHEKVSIPLVLHGASGVSRADIFAAIKNGIRKINIDTQLRRAFTESLKENVGDSDKDIRDFLANAKDDVKVVVEKYLKLFNNLE
ncbi:tagatose-bisphosphate aldolase [Candidatus Berkelbacteria bacterium CG08_land_8_20_14_0_20_39_8]|uniref:Tagatose-bisphosphate aldolase n=1 Tax=Candidatus Berkelbacteria bacterium CG08_land_8_20_14_0_20_39_8 TaxID=1974511 RepID=A0A2M6YC00_9BACT|nr:MAG: tagatose-bisphosphate aldolase [Candidatus Berkelbacteria bacterium CG08_land_8_20_14_0_20_39_8]